MKGIIIDVNYRRGLAIYYTPDYDYGYFEIIGDDSIETDDVIIGNLNYLGGEIIVKESTGEEYDVCIEDYGMTLQLAQEKVFG